MEWNWEHWVALVVWTWVWHSWAGEVWHNVWSWVKGWWS
jgi:hypothetical protein